MVIYVTAALLYINTYICMLYTYYDSTVVRSGSTMVQTGQACSNRHVCAGHMAARTHTRGVRGIPRASARLGACYKIYTTYQV